MITDNPTTWNVQDMLEELDRMHQDIGGSQISTDLPNILEDPVIPMDPVAYLLYTAATDNWSAIRGNQHNLAAVVADLEVYQRRLNQIVQQVKAKLAGMPGGQKALDEAHMFR